MGGRGDKFIGKGPRAFSPLTETGRWIHMHEEQITLRDGVARGFVIPLGPVNLVGAVAPRGIVGCGAIDVQALERFGYPAARVKPTGGDSITSIGDLLAGEIREANPSAAKLGVTVGLSGRQALELLC
jgi:uncharacterized protein YunC (DUF1805 family)